jgi:cysteinyl-tRNA synthetase
MMLTLYNTLTRRKEPFQPIDPANVRMYACGPTVYDYVHIGNGRMAVVFDMLFRILRHIYGPDHVTYARNITDVDDKINARAAASGVAIGVLTETTGRQYQEDVAALGCLPPTVEPRATEHIDEMKVLIEALVAKGHAYVADGHVLFHVPSMPDYGKLSNRPLEEMEAGARVDVAPYKRDPMDFVLWKPSKPGDPAWPSPSGINMPGRPGWHIECSAMAEKHLGEVFDIHGGGIDLVFPHHENEVAQSRCAHGTPAMANVWMHNGFLTAPEGEKMSKSLGNFTTIHALRGQWPGEALRLALLSAQYRQPLPWTERVIADARRTLDHWYELTAEAADGAPLCADVLEALEDDLNTPQAIAALHALRAEAAKGAKPAAACLKASARLMGLLQSTPAEWKAWRPATLAVDDKAIEAMIAARNAARKGRNFKEADRLRDELTALGIQLKDAKDPATGEIVTTWDVRASGAAEVKR